MASSDNDCNLAYAVQHADPRPRQLANNRTRPTQFLEPNRLRDPGDQPRAQKPYHDGYLCVPVTAIADTTSHA